MKSFRNYLALFIVSLIILPASSFAVGSGGFENSSFSAKQIGLGGAVTAAADEPAAISYNPAGLNDLEGIQYQGSANFVNNWTTIDGFNANSGSTNSSATTVFVPTGYLTVNPGNKFGLNDRFAFGIGTDSPFGLMNKYDSNHTAVKYTGYRNWLKMYTIKPVASFRFADWLSIGGGPIWYRIFDFGQIISYPNAAIAPAVGAGTPDGQLRGNLSGNAWGWHMGVLVKPAPKHKIGFYFRSPALIRLKGLLKGENIGDTLGGTNATGRFETGVHTKLHLPFNMSWGYQYKFNEKTNVNLDFGFTRWSVLDNLNAPVDPINNMGTTLNGAHNTLLNNLFNTPGPTGGADKDYRNGFTWAWGLEHKFSPKFTGRLGNYYYTTPVSGHSFTPTIPDSNRMAWTLGASYDFTENIKLDAAYDAVFFFRRKIDNDIGNPLSSVDGTYKSFLHVWVFSLTYKWDAFGSKQKVTDWEGAPAASALAK